MRNPFRRLVFWAVIFIAVLAIFAGARCWAGDQGDGSSVVGVTEAAPVVESAGGVASPSAAVAGAGAGALNIEGRSLEIGYLGTVDAAGLLGPVLNALGAKSGWLLALMTWMAALRFIGKPLMTAIETYVRNSPSKKDDAVLEEVERSQAFVIGCWLLDFIASVKFGTQFLPQKPISIQQAQGVLLGGGSADGPRGAAGPTNLPNADQLVKTASPAADSGKGGGNSNGIVTAIGMAFLILFAVPLCGTGCARLAPQGIYHGDKIAYDADALIDGAYAALDSFVEWHRANASVVDSKWPEIAAFAKQLEGGEGDQWIDDVLDLRDAYSKNPSAENRTKLQQGLAVLQTALAKAAVYQARLASKPNH